MFLRPAEPADALAVARVHVRSWQKAYRLLLPNDYLDQLRPGDRAATYDFATRDPRKPRTVVAVEESMKNGDSILGFVTTMPSREPDLPHHAELCALYVDPGHWGRGIGLALVSAARGHLRASGFSHVFLWMLAGNLLGERFYHADHWTPDGHLKTDILWGITVNEVRYQRDLELP